MSFGPCILEAQAWAKQNPDFKLDKGEINELGQLLEAASAGRDLTAAQKYALLNDAVLKRIELTQEARRGENYLNALKHVQSLDNIQKNIDRWGGKPGSAVDAFEAHITGESAKPGIAVNNDPLAASRTNQTRYMEFLENALSKPELKLLKALKPGDDMQGKIYQELDALRSKTREGQSGSDMALSIAKKLREAQDAVFNEAKAVNPYLNENQLFLASRSHNRELISKVPQAQWVADAKASFGKNLVGTDDDITKFLGDTYKSIVAGLPAEATDMTPRFWEPPGTGGSQAIQSAGKRVFVANDWKAEFDYNAKYGDSLYNSYAKAAERQADYIATVNKWGTQASANFTKLYNAVLKGLDTDEQKAVFLKNKDRLQGKFDDTQASRFNEAWSIQGRIAQGTNTAVTLAGRGTHIPRMLSSGPAMLSQLRSNGMNLFEAATSIAQSFGQLVAHLPDGGSSLMRDWSVSAMSVQRELSNQIMAGNGRELGAGGKLLRVLSQSPVADYITNAYKFMMAENDTRFFGGEAKKPYGELRPQTQETLQRHNLAGPRWEVLRQAVDENGRLTPEGLKRVSDEQVNAINPGSKATPATAQQIRGQIAQDYGTLLNRRASMTVAESNAASRSRAFGSTDVNTTDSVGLARNFFYQFKQAADVRQQLLLQTMRSGGGNTSNIAGSLEYMFHVGLMGAVGQQLIEMGANRKPLAMSDPKIFAHMLESTGLMGIWGSLVADFLTAPTGNRMRSMAEGDFIPPAVGTGIKGARALWQTGHGIVQGLEGKDRQGQYGGKEWADFAHSITPNQNLFYAKGALDYTLFNGYHNFAGDTGYLGRLREQMRQNIDYQGSHQTPLIER